ncbi:unnamed protein product [Ilex paraguariensis]|uniref:CI111 double-psi beta barrel domain-containing protein n=2 Tax=Ilex paraguariensis TaxID=185542 RepID=A0ABC8UUF5_9AQUA
MPSKTKKHSKTASSKFSHSDQTSPSSSSNLTPNPDVEFSEEDLLSALDEASLKYPSLIGKTAVIGRVTEDVGEVVDSKGCKIWLSQSSMVASSISPGSTVSVSLTYSGKKMSSNLPLSSLPDECARHFGFASTDLMANEAGNYFVLATVFPSCKV